MLYDYVMHALPTRNWLLVLTRQLGYQPARRSRSCMGSHLTAVEPGPLVSLRGKASKIFSILFLSQRLDEFNLTVKVLDCLTLQERFLFSSGLYSEATLRLLNMNYFVLWSIPQLHMPSTISNESQRHLRLHDSVAHYFCQYWGEMRWDER